MTKSKYLFLAISLIAGVLLGPTTALAQDADAEEDSRIAISEEQHKLNEEAVQAIFDEDYVRAISLLKESLLIGKLNVTYLNLGRAYQKAERCEEARRAYQKALTAPAVKQPKPRIIELQTRQYVEELEEQCDFDEQAKSESTSSSKESAAAPDTDGDADSEASDEDTVVADKTPASEGSEDDTDKSEAVEAPPDVDESSGGAAMTVGWATTIAGAALVGGGVGMHLLAESRRNELRSVEDNASNGVVSRDEMTEDQFERTEQQANTLDTVGLSMGIAGGVAAGVGVYLLLTSTPQESQTATNVWVTQGGAGVTWSTRF